MIYSAINVTFHVTFHVIPWIFHFQGPFNDGSFMNGQTVPSQTRPFDDEELEDTGERLLAIRRSQESLGWNRAKMNKYGDIMVILWYMYIITH